MIRVVSKRKTGIQPTLAERIIDIDRSNPVLGNRHVLHDEHDPQARAAVIAAHARDLAADIATNGPMSRELARISAMVRAGERIALRCWCAPRACHGDTYVAEIRRRLVCEA